MKRKTVGIVLSTLLVLLPALAQGQDFDQLTTRYTIDLSSRPQALEGYLGHYVYASGVGEDQVVIGWDRYTDATLRVYSDDFSQVVRETVLENFVLQNVMGMPDGSILVLGIYYPDSSLSIANAFQSDLPMDLIRVDPQGRIDWRTRLTGGNGTGPGETWYTWMPGHASADIAFNGTEYGVFLEVSHNYGDPGSPNTHQTDLFLRVDRRGRIVPGSRQFQFVSHSNELHTVADRNGFARISSGDANPFGLTAVHDSLGWYTIAWPTATGAELARMKEENRYTTGAGGIDRLVLVDDTYFVLASTSEDLPIEYMAGGDVQLLLIQMNEDGEVESRDWLTNLRSRVSKAFGWPYDEGMLVGYTIYENDEAGFGSMNLMQIDSSGRVVRGPQELPDARALYSTGVFEFPDGSAGWTVMHDSTTVDIYRVASTTPSSGNARSPSAAPTGAPGTTEAPLDFSGRWQTWWGDDSTDSIEMSIQTRGTDATGQYAFRDGVLSGRLEQAAGRLTMRGLWEQANSSGWYEFTLSEDRRRFSGTWGYGNESTASGRWYGERSNQGDSAPADRP